MTRVFISYRRTDSEGYVGRLYDRLKRTLHEEQIYLDVQSIKLGGDFARDISHAIRNSDAILIVIGNQWLNSPDERGQRRLDASNDYVRIEIALALKLQKLVIPILIQGAKMPPADSLPADIAGLSRLQATTLTHEHFEYDVERLLSSIKSRLSLAFLSDEEFLEQLTILFDLTGYIVITDKELVPSSALYIEDMRLGSTRRIVVVARSGTGSLTRSEVADLYSEHLPQYVSGQIDEVAVVSLAGLDEDAEVFVGGTRGLTHVKYSDLQNSLLDFRQYVAATISQFGEDGLSSYYVPICSIGTVNDLRPNLELSVNQWIASSEKRPIAILGGYGSGKTTFARRLAYALARQYQEDNGRRIPILLRLGDISGEQTLEGLLGKHFTTRAVVRNYSFDVFMALNSSGRFMIILDGFDEMKYTLTWDEFRYNFSQLNRLVAGKSKVILLGRPTAFLTEEEHSHILHGVRNVRGHALREPDWPDYIEYNVSPFNEMDIKEFLTKYITYRATPTKATKGRERSSITYEMNRIISSEHLLDLAKRPVHVKMLVEVLPQWRGAVDQLTMSLLYSHFIDLTIEREQGKIARKRFDTRERREFARDIAWWLWTSRKEASFVAESVPESLVRKFGKTDDDLDAVRRDLISACFLEKKLGGALYFPHRSFQEFLVAETLLDHLTHHALPLDEGIKWMTPEVMRFFENLVGSRELKLLSPVIGKFRGLIPLDLLRLWSPNSISQTDLILDLANRSERERNNELHTDVNFLNSPWCKLLAVMLVNKYKEHREFCVPLMQTFASEIVGMAPRNSVTVKRRTVTNAEFFQVNESDHTEDEIALRCLLNVLCILGLVGMSDKGSKSKRDHLIASEAISNCCNIGVFVELHDRRDQKSTALVPDFRVAELLSRVQVVSNTRSLNTKGVFQVLARHLREYCWLADWGNHLGTRLDGIATPASITQVPTSVLDSIKSFQSRFAFVSIDHQ